MSTLLVSTVITVHMFGIMSTDVVHTPFASRVQCENHVALQESRAKRYSDNVIRYEPGKLHISNQSTHRIQTYKCETTT